MSLRDHGQIATPIGRVTVTAIDGRISAIAIGGDSAPRNRSAAIDLACDQFEQWFAGERQTFDLPLVDAATPRGAALRAGLVAVGYGRTLSYGALARELKSSARAIGQACARNPLPIIVPCHRILAAGDVLGAYSAGNGPATKAWLLAHEQRVAGASR